MAVAEKLGYAQSNLSMPGSSGLVEEIAGTELLVRVRMASH